MANNNTAVTRREDVRELIREAPAGTIHPALQAQLDERKAINLVAAKLSGLNWGKALDQDTRRAVAEWARRYQIDAATEIQVLGGNVYLTAGYFMRRAAALIERGLIEYLRFDHIEHDERLDRLGEDGKREADRRLAERIRYQVPEKAASAVVCRVKLRSMAEEITGCKWAGNGTRKNDPVGDSFPVEASETRAARRALRQVITHVPELSQDFGALAQAGEDVSQIIEERRAAAKIAAQEQAARLPAGRGGVGMVDSDPYGTAADLDAATVQRLAAANPDPYGLNVDAIDPSREFTPAGDAATDDEPDLSAEPWPDELPFDPPRARRGRDALREG